MNTCKNSVLAFAVLTLARPLEAEELLIESAFSDSYHYIDHYEISINASAEEVWPILIDMRSWMDELAMRHESGAPQTEGQVFELYGDPNYRLEIIRLVPESMLAAANLPSSVDGEDSVGIAMLTLSESNGVTVVTSSMIRQYEWTGEGDDAQKARRSSDEYRELNETLWGNMLSRLKQQVED